MANYSLTDRTPDFKAEKPLSEKHKEAALGRLEAVPSGPKPCGNAACLIPVADHGGARDVHENFERAAGLRPSAK